MHIFRNLSIDEPGLYVFRQNIISGEYFTADWLYSHIGCDNRIPLNPSCTVGNFEWKPAITVASFLSEMKTYFAHTRMMYQSEKRCSISYELSDSVYLSRRYGLQKKKNEEKIGIMA